MISSCALSWQAGSHQQHWRHRVPAFHRRPRPVLAGQAALSGHVSVQAPDQAAALLPYGVAVKQGPRETMEDYVSVQPAHYGFLFTAVYDGHNGIAAAEYLVRNLSTVFDNVLDQQQSMLSCELHDEEAKGVFCPLPFQHVLETSFQEADQQLLQWLQDNVEGEAGNCGCTATAVMVRKDVVIVANVGDSRAVLCRGGQAVDLTVEHRVFGRGPAVKSETQRVLQTGGWVDDGRVCGVLAVSRAFGDPEFKGKEGLQRLLVRGVSTGSWTQKFADSRQFSSDPVIATPDVTELELGEADEFLIVATDGLWDVIGSQDVVQLARTNLKKGLSPQEVAEKLSQIALKRYTADNVGVVVVALKDLAQAANGNGSKSNGSTKKGLFGLW